MTNTETWMEILGWCGSAMVVAAYAMISAKKITADALLYQLLNIFGSSLLIAFTVYKEAYPPATVNSIWALIGLFALSRVLLRKIRRRRQPKAE